MLNRLFCAWLLVTPLFAVAAKPATPDRGERNWPQFRGPTGEGHSTGVGLPLEWSDTKNVAWKTGIPGSGWSSPVLYEGKLYLTTAVPIDGKGPKDVSLQTLCVDAARGEILWNREVFSQDGATTDNIHNKNSHASPTPVVEGDRLFVHFGTKGTACLDLAGNVLWRNRDLVYKPVHGNGGSPVLFHDKLMFSCDGGDVQFVVALDAATGQIAWKTPRDNGAPKKFAFATPLVIEVGGRPQLVSPGAGSVNSYDPETGREIWRVTYNGYSVIPRPVYGHGLVFICTGYDSPSLLAIRSDGEGDVTETHVEWKLSKGVPNSPSLTLVDDELYLISDGGVGTCLDAKTGAQHWQQRIDGKYSSSPIDAEGRLYLQSEDGDGTVIRLGKTFEKLARNSLGERTLASYAVGERALFIRSEKNLFRIQAE